jgi:hypothetical protein
MTNMFSKNLFTKIGISTLAITLFLVCSLFYYLAYRVVKADNNAKVITARLTSQGVTDKIDRNFYERFGDVQAFAFNKLAGQALDSGAATDDLQTFVNTMTAYYVLYDLMMICDLNGRVLVANTTDKEGNSINAGTVLAKNYAQEAWFKACTSPQGPEGGAWYSDFQANRDVAAIYKSNGYGMAFAAPVRNSDGKVTGVWYNFASWREVTQAIREEAEGELLKSDPAARILLTDASGTIIDASNGELTRNRVQFPETEELGEANTAILKNYQLDPSLYLSGWATARGAYTYKGNKWKALTLLSKSSITAATFLSGELLQVILVSLLLITLTGVYIFAYFKREIIHKINGVKGSLEALAEGELVQIPAVTGQNEVARMMVSLGHLAESLRHKAAFSDEIAKGCLDTQLRVVSGKDVLGNSLLNMRDKLKEVAEEDRRRNWTVEGLARFGELMRSGKDFTDLCNSILSGVVQYLHANQGALFVTRGEDGESPTLVLTACYAFDRRKYLEKTIHPGQGLVGQTYLEGETIYLTDVPNQYVTIGSGLGEAKPGSILIVPLKVNDKVEGVLELASFRPYQPHEIEFAEKVAGEIATTLATAQTAARTLQLLQQSQQQAEEMKAQEEEMMQNMEEMNATQEEYLRSERGYQQQISQLEAKIATLEAQARKSESAGAVAV